jgi:hypothetical protein
MVIRLLLPVLLIAAVAAGGYIAGMSTGRPANSTTALPDYVGFDPTEIDLGEQLWGLTLDVPLKLVNRSQEPIEIAAARSSCGCTVIQNEHYDGKVVPPGESFQFDIRVTRGKTRAGARARSRSRWPRVHK